MRIAALYDIHANLPALEAVIADVRLAGVDGIVVGGDVVPGPMPRETIACLQELGLPVQYISGNGEREVGEQMNTGTCGVPPAWRETMRWVAEALDRDHERLFASWPATITCEITGLGAALFCHATPRNDSEIVTRLTPDEVLAPVFAGVAAPLVVCGHTHMQFDRHVGATRVVNAGSVGMPFGEPGAYWLLLGPGVELRRTAYDLDRAAARIRATEYPQAADFAAHNVLAPPSESVMLEAFQKAALR
jgi:predicted phosphodiesterase